MGRVNVYVRVLLIILLNPRADYRLKAGSMTVITYAELSEFLSNALIIRPHIPAWLKVKTHLKLHSYYGRQLVLLLYIRLLTWTLRAFINDGVERSLHNFPFNTLSVFVY